jgi:enoyl-CoA hydratase/carnithine racemase
MTDAILYAVDDRVATITVNKPERRNAMSYATLAEAARLLFSDDFLSAEDALRLGFVSAVVEADDLLVAARTDAERYLSSWSKN